MKWVSFAEVIIGVNPNAKKSNFWVGLQTFQIGEQHDLWLVLLCQGPHLWQAIKCVNKTSHFPQQTGIHTFKHVHSQTSYSISSKLRFNVFFGDTLRNWLKQSAICLNFCSVHKCLNMFLVLWSDFFHVLSNTSQCKDLMSWQLDFKLNFFLLSIYCLSNYLI